MTMEMLYKENTGKTTIYNSQDEIDIDYVLWLEEKAAQNVCDSTRSVYPLLADVLSDIDTIDLNDGGSRFITVRKDKLKEKLGKYFS